MWRNSKTVLKNKRNEKGWYKQILKYFMELCMELLEEERGLSGVNYESESLISATLFNEEKGSLQIIVVCYYKFGGKYTLTHIHTHMHTRTCTGSRNV